MITITLTRGRTRKFRSEVRAREWIAEQYRQDANLMAGYMQVALECLRPRISLPNVNGAIEKLRTGLQAAGFPEVYG